MTFEQAASSFGWGELVNFSRHLPLSSATHRALNSDEYRFSTDLQRNEILADIYDVLATVFCKEGENPMLFPRPWDTGRSQRIGSDPIPISEFNKWYYGGE
jgi:hypothetical protein